MGLAGFWWSVINPVVGGLQTVGPPVWLGLKGTAGEWELEQEEGKATAGEWEREQEEGRATAVVHECELEQQEGKATAEEWELKQEEGKATAALREWSSTIVKSIIKVFGQHINYILVIRQFCHNIT